jgi:hypothetical protein
LKGTIIADEIWEGSSAAEKAYGVWLIGTWLAIELRHADVKLSRVRAASTQLAPELRHASDP